MTGLGMGGSALPRTRPGDYERALALVATLGNDEVVKAALIELRDAQADGEAAVPLLPKRALTLAQELLTRGVQAIKADSWDIMYEQGAPQRAPDLGAA